MNPALILLALGGGVLLLGRKKKRSLGDSPISADCAELVNWTQEQWGRWSKDHIMPHLAEAMRMEPLRDAFDTGTVNWYASYVASKAMPACYQSETAAAKRFYKGIWCEIVMLLVGMKKIDEELEDVIRLCSDPTFQPPQVIV